MAGNLGLLGADSNSWLRANKEMAAAVLQPQGTSFQARMSWGEVLLQSLPMRTQLGQ